MSDRSGDENQNGRPTIVAICGPLHLKDRFTEESLLQMEEGKIVLPIGFDERPDDKMYARYGRNHALVLQGRMEAARLAKIDLADDVLVLGDGNGLDDATRRVVAYAHMRGKLVLSSRAPGSWEEEPGQRDPRSSRVTP